MVRIDPDRIRTRQDLTLQLAELYHQGGWSRHRLAEAAGLSPATVQGVVTGSTGIPQTGTLRAFVTACGHKPEPWVQARGRVVQAEQASKSKKEGRPVSGPVNLPFRVPDSFVGRVDELSRLDEVLRSARGAVVQAVHGLGGIGKSTLVAQWATTRLSDHTLTWWITADAPTAIDEGLAALAVALHPEAAGQSHEVLAAQAVRWLCTHSGWLLILDNVCTPGDVEPLLARVQGGRFLITSRLSVGWHRITSAVVRLDVFRPDEATALLTRILTFDRPDADLNGADELCAELGHLPLAVEQAAAYIYQAGISPGRYLELLARQPAVVLRQAGEGDGSERTVARVWRVTMDRLTDTPLAGHLLRILAWYAPDRIPRTVLDDLADPSHLQHAIGRLAAYSLVTPDDDDTLRVHRLVQTVSRTPDSADPHRKPADVRSALHQATRLLRNALPDDLKRPDLRPVWRSLLPHVTALADHTPEDTDTPITSYLFTAVGLFLADQGFPARAIALHQRALDALVRAGLSDHQNGLSARNNLAMAYQYAGNLNKAIELYQQIVADQERVLGSDHPNTLASLGNLAMTYQAAGKLRQATTLLERTLAALERSLGVDHPCTLNYRNSLALAYRDAGDLKRAIPQYERNLATQERTQGADHPHTLVFRVNLAAAHEAAGDAKQAIILAKGIVTDCGRTLGSDHPYTLAAQKLLARAYQSSGNLKLAIELFEHLLDAHELTLGKDHPQTLINRNNLAAAYHAAGDLGQAVPLYEQNRTDLERVLGKDHPMTLSCQSNLAMAYHEAGNEDEGADLLRQALDDCERVLGAEHPYTLNARHNQAKMQWKSDDVARIVEHAQQVLADYERVLGTDHPHTLISRNNLALACRDAGEVDRALRLSTQTVADSERVHGTDHPSTLEARHNLALIELTAGNLWPAITLYTQTLADCKRTLGDEHPLTNAIQETLGRIRTAFPQQR